MYKILFLAFVVFFTFACDESTPTGGNPDDGKGKLGEPCYDNGSCDVGLFCNGNNICEEIIQGDCTPGISQDCYTGDISTLGIGVCKEGKRLCSPEGEWGVCEGDVTPIAEQCGDNVDNNCNGLVDEDCGCPQEGATRACYSGSPGTEGIGICRVGYEVCAADGQWSGTCVDEVVPVDEVCGDRKDNNCNGEIDEDCGSCTPNEQRDCYSGPAGTENIGICKAGNEVCTVEQSWSGNCVGETLPLEEICGDGLDNDCNGEIDEGCPCTPGESRPCYTGNEDEVGKGICHSGIQVCNQSGEWEQNCVNEQKPETEVCDGQDNNCDGLVDEGVSNSCGECGAEPQEVCDGVDNNCNGLIDEGVLNRCGECGAEPQEVCNDGLDNDCDGDIDEGCHVDCNGDPNCNENWECQPFTDGNPTTRSCYTGAPQTANVGLCHNGTQICINGFWSGCNQEALPNVEICDGEDNNCDGEVDENCGHNNCSGFEVCNDGIDNNCDGDIDENCNQTPECIPTGAENCDDNLDNDCNGSVNDGCLCQSGQQQECYGGPVETINIGRCQAGTQSCIGGEAWGECSGQITPIAETCNGEDDDCDGIIDNGFYVGTPCVVGSGSCQRAGVYQCSTDGGVECVDTSGNPVVAGEPDIEICDGQDNNCNGQVDEGFTLNQPCYSGLGACRAPGRTICSELGDTVVCDATPYTASAEICGNEIDDDCNGLRDDVEGIGAPCSAGEGACARTGEHECVNGEVICNATPLEPADYELCGDGVDNNCNGDIDEGYSQYGSQCVVGIGACERTGSYICTDNLLGVECDAVPGTGSDEICGDNIDNDCDGWEDNDPELNLGVTCYVGEGICRNSGVYICQSNNVTCNATPNSADPRGEICANGIDDDCDGDVDEADCLSLNEGPVVQCPIPPLERGATVDQYGGRAFTLHNYPLTATASDPNNDALTYSWEIIAAPDGNGQTPTPVNSLTTYFEPYLISARQSGEPQPYILRFTATETNTAEHESASCEVKFLAISEDFIHVELIWGNATDMDLHMVVPGNSTTDTSVFSRSSGDGVDCNYSNCDDGNGMDWSGASTVDQRPHLDIDNVQGFGASCSGTNCDKPENINVPDPRPNNGDIYQVGVHAYSGNGSNLRIKVNCLGQNSIDVIKEYNYNSISDEGWWLPAYVHWHTNYCTIEDR